MSFITRISLSLACLFIAGTSFSQSAVMMPARVTITPQKDAMAMLFSMQSLVLNPNLNPENIKYYQERYTPILEDALLSAFSSQELDVLPFAEIGRVDAEEEEALYNDIYNGYVAFSAGNSKALIKSQAVKDLKQPVERTQPITSKYGETLERDILIYYSFKGAHDLKEDERLPNNLAPEVDGSLMVHIWFVDASSGLVIEATGIDLTQNSAKPSKLSNKELTESRISYYAGKIAKETRKKLKKLGKKK